MHRDNGNGYVPEAPTAGEVDWIIPRREDDERRSHLRDKPLEPITPPLQGKIGCLVLIVDEEVKPEVGVGMLLPVLNHHFQNVRNVVAPGVGDKDGCRGRQECLPLPSEKVSVGAFPVRRGWFDELITCLGGCEFSRVEGRAKQSLPKLLDEGKGCTSLIHLGCSFHVTQTEMSPLFSSPRH